MSKIHIQTSVSRLRDWADGFFHLRACKIPISANIRQTQPAIKHLQCPYSVERLMYDSINAHNKSINTPNKTPNKTPQAYIPNCQLSMVQRCRLSSRKGPLKDNTKIHFLVFLLIEKHENLRTFVCNKELMNTFWRNAPSPAA